MKGTMKFVAQRDIRREIAVDLFRTFMHGFFAYTLTVFIVLRWDWFVLGNLLVFYSFQAMTVYRSPYKTKFGKHIIYPLGISAGAFTGYTFGYWLQALLS